MVLCDPVKLKPFRTKNAQNLPDSSKRESTLHDRQTSFDQRMPAKVGKIGDNSTTPKAIGHGVDQFHLMEKFTDAIDGYTERFDVFASMPNIIPCGEMSVIPYAVGCGTYFENKLGI